MCPKERSLELVYMVCIVLKFHHRIFGSNLAWPCNDLQLLVAPWGYLLRKEKFQEFKTKKNKNKNKKKNQQDKPPNNKGYHGYAT